MGCKDCIYESFPKIPPSEIKQCDLAIVGESPGNTEIAFKKPFIGPSGKLLNDTLHMTDLPVREDIFVTNALLCRPPEEENVKRDAIINCRERLIKELQAVEPKMVLCLGNIATHAVLNNFKFKITNVNGKILKSPYLPKTKVIPIFHPAAVLHNPGNRQPFNAAFKYASHIFRGGKPKKLGEIYYTILEDDKTLIETLKYLMVNYKYSIFGTDIETKRLSPYSGKTLYIGVAFESNLVIMFTHEKLHLPIMKEFFGDKDLQFGWQNGQFDTAFLTHLDIPARIDQDSMILHYCMNEHEGYHDLDTLSMRELGADIYSWRIKPFIERMDEAPRWLWAPYLAKDCAYTKQLIDKFLPIVEKDMKLNPLYHRILLPAANMLKGVQLNGFYMHRDYCTRYKKVLETDIADIGTDLSEQFQPYWDPKQYQIDSWAKSIPKFFNPGSNKQLGWMIYDKLKLEPTITKSTNKGKCVDKDVLNSLKGQHKAIDTLLLQRSKKKTLSTYVEAALTYADPDDRIRSQFWLTRTTSGRLASRKPNLQNIDRRSTIKNIFGAPSGRVIIEADYKGLELRVLAHLSHDKYFTEVFMAGRDPHNEMSRSIHGDTYTKEQRVKVKGVNFGVAYGRGPQSIAEEFDMTIYEAKHLIAQWYEKAKGAEHYLTKCEYYLMKNKIFVTPFGRKRRFGSIARYLEDKGKVAHLKREARNFPIQSTASDLTLLAAMDIQNKVINISDPKHNIMIVNLVHDSIITEAPNNEAIVMDLIHKMKDVMEVIPQREIQPVFSFPAEFSVGTHWGAMKELDI